MGSALVLALWPNPLCWAQPRRAGHEPLPLDTVQPGEEVVFKISIYCCHNQQKPTTFSMF